MVLTRNVDDVRDDEDIATSNSEFAAPATDTPGSNRTPDSEVVEDSPVVDSVEKECGHKVKWQRIGMQCNGLRDYYTIFFFCGVFGVFIFVRFQRNQLRAAIGGFVFL